MGQNKSSAAASSKFSAMLLAVADGYVQMGRTTQERENYLRGAVSAWNIGCLRKSKREQAVRNLVEQFARLNPTVGPEHRANFERNIRKLIRQKDRLYPHVKTQILGCTIELIDGQEQVAVVFSRSLSAQEAKPK